MSTGLDTSVVLRLLTGEPQDQALVAFAAIEERRNNRKTLFVSDLVLSEVYFALQHHYGVPKSEALSLLSVFLRDSGVKPAGVAATVLATPNLATSQPGFVDRLIHAEYRQTADEILTFEKAGKRLPGVLVL